MKKDQLISDLDDFFHTMLEEARKAPAGDADNPSEYGFGEKLKLFAEGVRWVAVKNKIEPEGPATDAFSKLRKRAGSGARRSRAVVTAPAPGLINGVGTDG